MPRAHCPSSCLAGLITRSPRARDAFIKNGRTSMTATCIPRYASLAGACAGFVLALSPAMAQTPPGFSPLDRSNPQASQQDVSLKPHATPPTVTPADKLPVDKLKLPAGFKAEVWSHGH